MLATPFSTGIRESTWWYPIIESVHVLSLCLVLGVAVFWDPLRYTPVINIYRRMATKVRTEDEHPLGKSDVRLMRRTFGVLRWTRAFPMRSSWASKKAVSRAAATAA